MRIKKITEHYNLIFIFALWNVFIQITLFASKRIYPESFNFISPAAAYGQLLANAFLISTQIGKTLEAQNKELKLYKMHLNNFLLIIASLISPFFSGTYLRNQIIRDGGGGVRNKKLKTRYEYFAIFAIIFFLGIIFYFYNFNNWKYIYFYFGSICFISVKMISLISNLQPHIYIPSYKNLKLIIRLSIFDFTLALSPAIILGLLYSNVLEETYQIALQFVLATLATGFFSNIFQTLFISQNNSKLNKSYTRKIKSKLSNYELFTLALVSIISSSTIAIYLQLPFLAILITIFYGFFGVISSRAIVDFRDNCIFLDKLIASLIWILFLLVIFLLLKFKIIIGLWTLNFFLLGALINTFIKEIVNFIKFRLIKIYFD